MKLARHRTVNRALTLVEMLVSLALVSILLVATGSTLIVMAKVAPGGGSEANQISGAARVLERMVQEIETAKSITKAEAFRIEFSVADRDDDASDETIRYEWKGSPGTPDRLVRQYNGGATAVVLESVHDFALSYDSLLRTPTITSPETLLKGYTAIGASSTNKLTAILWPGQYFHPQIPADSISWAVTRVLWRVTFDGSKGGDFLAQLRLPAPDFLPTSTIIDEVVVLESALPNKMNWFEVAFPGADGLSPNEGLCLVFEHRSGTSAMKYEYEGEGVTMPASGMLTYDGQNWIIELDKSLSFAVYGNSTTPDPDSPPAVRLLGVGITLNPSASDSTRLRSRASVLNEPVMPGL